MKRWLRNFADHHAREDETVEGLRSISHLLGFNSVFMGTFFLTNGSLISWPSEIEMVQWWSYNPLGFGLWDVLFPLSGILLIAATFFRRGVVKAHMLSALVWLAMGVLWVSYSFVYRPEYMFGVGVLAIFIAAQHFVYTRLWKAEGVE